MLESVLGAPLFQVAFGLLLVYLVVHVVRKWKRHLPPGPMGLPVVGSIPFIGENPHLKFIELAEKYGDVFSVRLGSEVVVVLNSTESIREAFSKKEFLGRPPFNAISLLGGKSPFFQLNMKVWQEQRRFFVHSLRDLGLGRSKIEVHVQEEIQHFLEALGSRQGQPMNVVELLTPSMSNNICALAFGKRYQYEDPERVLLDRCLDAITKVIGQTTTLIFFPWIPHFSFVLNALGYKKALEAFRSTDRIFESKIEEHRSTLDPKNVRDFTDSYLLEMAIRKEKDPDTTFDDETLLGLIGNMFGAGSETVRTSISWVVYVMAAFPQTQARVRAEMEEVVGRERMAELRDLKEVPFTHAVILEVMRWKTIVPLNVLRYTLEDTSVGGYDIPRNTIVMANFWAIHHDARNWDKPDEFIPERFLSPDGKSVVKPPHYMPFSYGKRVCPGESMAYMEIFLYFASILQKFEIRFPEGVEATFDAVATISYKPKPFKVRFIPRN